MARGDHIYVKCGFYSHHGIDLGDGQVIHFDFSPKRKITSVFGDKKPEIKISSMDEFSNGQEIQVRDYQFDSESESIAASATERVIERAKSRLGETSYHLFRNNCEHFAVWCKTGKPVSSQVESAKAASKPLSFGIASVYALRMVSCLPTPIRPVVASATIGYSVGKAVTTYYRRRKEDEKSNRS